MKRFGFGLVVAGSLLFQLSTFAARHKAQATPKDRYVLLQDPGVIGINVELSLRSFVQAADCSGDVEGTVDAVTVGNHNLELWTKNILHENGKAWIATKKFGRIEVSGCYAGDHPPNGLGIWLTSAQLHALTRLYHSKAADHSPIKTAPKK